MFAVVSTLTASPEIIGHVSSVHRDLRRAVESERRIPNGFTRIVVLDGRAKPGDYLSNADGWRDLSEQEREEALAYMDEEQ